MSIELNITSVLRDVRRALKGDLVVSEQSSEEYVKIRNEVLSPRRGKVSDDKKNLRSDFDKVLSDTRKVQKEASEKYL